MAYQSSYNYHNRPIEIDGQTYNSRIHAYNAGKMTKVTDPSGKSHYFDPATETFGGFQQRRGEGGFGKPIDSYTINLVQAAKPAPAPEPEPVTRKVDELQARADAQQASQDAYFDKKIAEVEALVPDPPAQQPTPEPAAAPEPVDRTPTAVDQGATVKDLQIASEGDDAAALKRTKSKGIGGLTSEKRRKSLLAIPTF